MGSSIRSCGLTQALVERIRSSLSGLLARGLRSRLALRRCRRRSLALVGQLLADEAGNDTNSVSRAVVEVRGVNGGKGHLLASVQTSRKFDSSALAGA